MGQTNVKNLGNGGTMDGDVTITGDLTVSGGVALTLNEVLQGTSTIDVTNTEALLVRKDSDGGDVFIVDTTNSRVGIGGSSSSAKLQITGGDYATSLLIKGSGSNTGIKFVDNTDAIDGYAYAENGQIGFLDAGGDWMINAKNDDFIRFAITAGSE